MKFLSRFILACFFLSVSICHAQNKKVGGGCEGIYEEMPQNLNWETTIPNGKEPGEPLEISGTIFKADGKDHQINQNRGCLVRPEGYYPW